MSHQVSPAQSCCRCTKKVGGHSRVHTPRPMWVTGKWDTALIQGPMRVGGQPINRLALAALTSSRDPEDHCRSALRHSICNRTSLRTLRHQTRRDVGASLRRPNHCRSQVALISPKMVASRHRRNLPHSISQGFHCGWRHYGRERSARPTLIALLLCHHISKPTTAGLSCRSNDPLPTRLHHGFSRLVRNWFRTLYQH